MNEETIQTASVDELEARTAAITAETLLAMLEIIGADAREAAAMAREAVEGSVLPECGYERALALYLNVLGIVGKAEEMMKVMTPEVVGVLSRQAQALRDRTHATCH